jgi:hypothetical protein
MDDDTIRAMVTRLSRKHPSGGSVIERAAILAEGADLDDVVAWITAHAGEPEAAPAPKHAARGLYDARPDQGAASGRPPRRYVLPSGALD